MAKLEHNVEDYAPVDTSAKVWSSYQKAIFDFVANGRGNAIVRAVAGSGKSTTIIEAIQYVNGQSLFLAFNKSIADELKAKGVNGRTFHSLCYGPVLRATGASKVDENKIFKLIKDGWSSQNEYLYGAYARKMISLAKQSGIGCLVEDTREAWIAIGDHHDIYLDPLDGCDPDVGLQLTRDLFKHSITLNTLDFDDLLYYAVKYTVPLSKFDFIFCDEAQDTNAIQRAILKKIMHANSRIIAVGDPAQAIYGFRGADSNSLTELKDAFNCIELPLSISYRCAKSIVQYARNWENTILARDGAPEGTVSKREQDWNIREFTDEDLVVCRTTAPLIKVAFRMLKSRLPVKVLGRDIGMGLKRLIDKMRATSIDQLEVKLMSYRDREVLKHQQRGEDSLAQSVEDKVEALLVLCESLAEDERTVERLISVLGTIFNDRSDAVTLSTIHRAKGLEAKRVYWLNSSQCPSKWAKKSWQLQQEHNLCYVATTRAKLSLELIETGT